MKDDKPKNIFDEAAHSRPFKKKAPAKAPTPPPVPEENAGSLEESITTVKKYRDDVVKKLDSIQKELGMSLKDVKEYINNPRNFKPSQWAYIQQQKKEMEERLAQELGSDVVGVSKKVDTGKVAKERKGKTLGSRKNWIPIR